MAGSFVCTMVSTAKQINAARPSDTVRIHFSDPPDAATDVTIELIQADTSKVVTTFKGAFVGKVFKSSVIIGNTFVTNPSFTKNGRPSDDLEQLVHMVVTFDVDGKSKCKVRMSDPPAGNGGGPTNLENKLKIRVSGTITGGGQQTFEGQSLLHIYYPQVMIVPSGRATTDEALNIIPKWAIQWQKHHKEMRTIVPLPIIIPPTLRKPARDIVPADYDAIVAAVKKAMAAAPDGIIALAVGHGDGGFKEMRRTADGVAEVQGDPWCDLVSEDSHLEGDTFPHDLYINLPRLREGAGETQGNARRAPGQATVVRLNGMDRMADALTAAADEPRLRKILLHTCNAGNSEEFMNAMADRLAVRIQAHRNFIKYTGNVAGSIQAHYEGEIPTNPEALQEWPLAQTSTEYYPSKTRPPRFTP